MMNYRLLLILLMAVGGSFLAVTDSADARQFRRIVPIAAPVKIRSVLPDDAVPVKTLQQLGREDVKAAVNQVLSKWNTGELEQVLSKDFFDRSRLTDAVDTIVPRDATLRVESIQGVQTLQQYIMPADDGNTRVSIVSATVRTQLEFNASDGSYVRLPGVNEFILKVTQPVTGP